MARKLRIQSEGAIYHVMNRGDHREDIFRSDKDRELFIETLGQACSKTDWQIHAWCLMSNHFHLVVETPKANLVDGMKWLLGPTLPVLTGGTNFSAFCLAGATRAFLSMAAATVISRPCAITSISIRPGQSSFRPKRSLGLFRWSSYGEYVKAKRQRLPWLRVDR